jgi:hypothetical protein
MHMGLSVARGGRGAQSLSYEDIPVCLAQLCLGLVAAAAGDVAVPLGQRVVEAAAVLLLLVDGHASSPPASCRSTTP